MPTIVVGMTTIHTEKLPAYLNWDVRGQTVPPPLMEDLHLQVADIDVKKQSPCGHGTVICFSVYGGKDIHLASEPPIHGVRKTQLWVDTYCNGEGDVSLRFWTH